MTQLVIIEIVSYFLSSALTVDIESKKQHIFDFLKGYLLLFLAGIYLHSGLSYLLASTGIIAGHLRPIFYDFKGKTIEMVALGIIFYMSPTIATLLLISFIIIKKLCKNYRDSVFATSFIIPILAFKFFNSDSFVIISIIICISLIIEFWPTYLKIGIKPKTFIRVIIGFIGIFFILILFFNKYVYKGLGMQRDIIRQGTEHFKYVALTFDDGPDPVYTSEILDILKEKRVKATFFLVGKNVEDYPQIAQRIAQEGHNIGNHTYSHKSLIPLSNKKTMWEIKEAEKVIEEATGIRTTLFRPPRGIYSKFSRKFLKDERYTIVLWTISAVDWAELTPNSILKNVIKKVEPGTIILLHDSGDLITYKGGDRSATVKALPDIIDNLRSQGYEFVTVEQLIFFTELMETEE